MDPPPPPPPPPPPSPAVAPLLACIRSLLSLAASSLSSLPSSLTHPTPTTLPSHPSPTTTLPIPTPTVHPPPSPSSHLTFPLPPTAAPSPYADCPAVVTSHHPPTPVSFPLPGFLATELADFSAPTTGSSPPPCILPSELCLLRREVEAWGVHGLPASYSYAATRAVAALCRGGLPRDAELKRWLVRTSPRFGVVIDPVMRDHVWVLTRLCLKAAATEADCSLECVRKGEVEGGGFDPRVVRFECPRLVESFLWLAAQLGILYGQGNGKLFVLGIVKEAMLQSGSCLAVGVGDGVSRGEVGETEARRGGNVKESASEDVGIAPLFVSHVAAAIVALHERFWLEERIKALRFAPQSTKSQLLLEYSQALARGHDERAKRPNYRAVLEYDGLLSCRIENQVSGRSKTREELLAEERDYKRRRMSYRGKKVKRNPTEILRDIIDDHMEEIKQAGGIGCLVKAPGEGAQNLLENNSHGASYQESFNHRSSSYDKAVLDSRSPSYENSPHADLLGRGSSRSRDTRDSHRKFRHETHGHHYRKVSEHDSREFKESESAITDRSSHQHEHSRHQRHSSDQNKYGYRYKKNVLDYLSESSDCTRWSTRTSRSLETEYDHNFGDRINDRIRNGQNSHRSVSVTQNQFSDRYEPSDGDPLTGRHYDGSDHLT